MGDSSADSSVEAQLKRSEDLDSHKATGHCRDSLAKNLSVICCCPKNFPEAKVKSSRGISLVKETSRQSNIDSVVW